jgi:hypothetical protein
MQQNFDNIRLLFPASLDWGEWKRQKTGETFEDEVVAFLNALSSSLMKDPAIRLYPDVATFAFFCRKNRLLALKQKYQNGEIRRGRGIVFHIAPSNVPVNFAYSLVAGLLSGNANIVRVSSKQFPQVDLIIKHLHKTAASKEHFDVARRIALVVYERNSSATGHFSSICDVRIIWGGDETIAQIRRNSIPARSFDITFADRYSLAAINADALVKEPNLQRVAEGFYNDTYLFDQNACSAPHLIVWTGAMENIKTAQRIFWDAVYNEVKKTYHLQAVLSIEKLTTFYRQATNMPVHRIEMQQHDNALVRVQLDMLPLNIDEFRCIGGYFSEYIAGSLHDIAAVVNHKYQTLAYYGYDKNILQQLVVANRLSGIDRIVPVGSTTDFALIWDGYDLINTFSRVCTIL